MNLGFLSLIYLNKQIKHTWLKAGGMKKYLIVLICTTSFQSCSILNDGIGHHNYLTRIQASSKCHQPKQARLNRKMKSIASLPGGGPPMRLSDPYDASFFREMKTADRFWFPPR